MERVQSSEFRVQRLRSSAQSEGHYGHSDWRVEDKKPGKKIKIERDRETRTRMRGKIRSTKVGHECVCGLCD